MKTSLRHTAKCKWLPAALLLPLLLASHPMVLAQDRAVTVVYDNSGSMKTAGQCEGVNYAMQVLVGLLHPSDELTVFKMEPPQGTAIDLGNKRNTIGMVKNTYDCQAQNTPFDALANASGRLSKSSKKNKWLIVLSDGEIDGKSFPSDTRLLRTFVEETGARIVFLNVNDKTSALDRYLEQSGTPQLTLRTGGSFEQVIGRMESIASGIMTISEGGVKVSRNGNTARLNSPVPLKRLIVLQQDASVNASLPRIISAKAADGNLYVQEAVDAQKSKGSYRMTGNITHLQKNKAGAAIIPKGEIAIGFSGGFDLQKVKFLPEAAALLEVEIDAPLKRRHGNQYTVCDTLGKVTVLARLTDLQGKPLDMEVLRQSKVRFVNEETKSATNMLLDSQTGEFKASFTPRAERMPISVVAEFPGYFNFQSNILVVDKAHCPTPTAFIESERASIRALVTDMGNAPTLTITPKIKVENELPRNPTPAELEFLDIELANDDLRLGLDVQKKGGKLYIKPTAFICACFTKTGSDEIELRLKSNSPHIKVDKKDTLKMSVTITDASFWEKCGWLLLTAIGLLALLWYVVGLLKKPRFCRGSEVIVTKHTQMMKRKPRSNPLPTGFFNRYLVPYLAEKRVVDSVTFKAGASCSHILIDADSQSENMFVSGLPVDNPGKKDLRLSNGEQMEISRRNGKEIYEYRKLE